MTMSQLRRCPQIRFTGRVEIDLVLERFLFLYLVRVDVCCCFQIKTKTDAARFPHCSPHCGYFSPRSPKQKPPGSRWKRSGICVCALQLAARFQLNSLQCKCRHGARTHRTAVGSNALAVAFTGQRASSVCLNEDFRKFPLMESDPLSRSSLTYGFRSSSA